ncbi:MAG: hypothetical protein WKG01_07715 [Kofleriaceae bacterium]
MTPNLPMRRARLKKLVINELSGVDSPCHQHARAAIMKRAITDAPAADAAPVEIAADAPVVVEKRVDPLDAIIAERASYGITASRFDARVIAEQRGKGVSYAKAYAAVAASDVGARELSADTAAQAAARRTPVAPGMLSPDDQLDEMAEAYAKQHGVPVAKAFAAVFRSDEGRAVYLGKSVAKRTAKADRAKRAEDASDQIAAVDAELEQLAADHATRKRAFGEDCDRAKAMLHVRNTDKGAGLIAKRNTALADHNAAQAPVLEKSSRTVALAQEFDELCAEHAQEHGMSIEKATSPVMHSKRGREVYNALSASEKADATGDTEVQYAKREPVKKRRSELLDHELEVLAKIRAMDEGIGFDRAFREVFSSPEGQRLYCEAEAARQAGE